MAGLDPAIHDFLLAKTWMPGTSPGMTERKTKGRERSRPFFITLAVSFPGRSAARRRFAAWCAAEPGS
jgi:hypothetical protein